MKFAWMTLALLLTAGAAASGALVAGCGPEEKFCPATNGPCPLPPPPPRDAGPDTGSTDTPVDRPRDRGRNNNT